MKTRTSLIAIALIIISVSIKSQNIQLHFDPRHALLPEEFTRNYLTVRFEMDKSDKWGNTYLRSDFDFNQTKGNLGLSYLEIARNIKLGNKVPFMAHLEYNGGLGSWGSIPNAYLVGASYMTKYKNFHLETYLAYRYNAFEKASNDIQWTLRWNSNLGNNKFTFSGYVDIWSENKNRFDTEDRGKFVITLSELQLWYNATSNFSVGTKIEVSNKHYRFFENKVYVLPTIAAKWEF